MQPTLRLLLVLLLAVPGIAIGGLAAAVSLALAVVAMLAGVADWWLAGRHDPRSPRVRREVDETLSLGAWNPVRVVLSREGEAAQRAGRHLELEVRDQPPLGFRLDPPEVVRRVVLDRQGSAEMAYRVWPPARGDHQFGTIHIRTTGPLGLARAQRTMPDSAATVRVYPNLRDLRKFELLARRGMMAEAGTRAVRRAGASTEFERLRDYLPDDEFRLINWKATARRGRPIVNQFEAERSQNLVIMLDAGRLMAARLAPSGEGGLTDEALLEEEREPGLAKLDHALNTALLLAYVGSARGDRVALLAYDDAVRVFLPPRRGRGAFLACMQALYNLQPQPVEPDHGLAFQFLLSRSLRRSLVVLFTDLVDKESSTVLAQRVAGAARHHQVVCVTLADPTIGRPARARPKDVDGLYAKMVAQRMLDERAAVLATLGRHGVMTVDASAETLSPKLVQAYLELKLRGRV